MALKRTISVVESSGAKASSSKKGKYKQSRKRSAKARSSMPIRDSGPELKYVDTTATQTPIALASTPGANFQLLNGVAQGTDNNNRIGRKIQVKSVHVTALFSALVDATDLFDCVVKWWIIYDSQPDGTAMTVGEMWAAMNLMVAPHNLDNSDRFKVLRTGTGHLCPQGVNAGETPGYATKYYIDEHVNVNDVCRYQGTGATIASLSTGAYYFATTTDFQGAASGPQVLFNGRIKFTDA